MIEIDNHEGGDFNFKEMLSEDEMARLMNYAKRYSELFKKTNGQFDVLEGDEYLKYIEILDSLRYFKKLTGLE